MNNREINNNLLRFGIVSVVIIMLMMANSFLNTVQKKPAPKLSIIKRPSVTQAQLGTASAKQDYQFFDLPTELSNAQIHDILFHNNAMWLGTDRGLAKIAGNQITIYRQYSDWPFEWIRDLVITPSGIALQAHVALGNTGGNPAGSHIFNPQDESWSRLGNNILAQSWLNGYLYQASAQLIRRHPANHWKQEVLLSSLCNRRPSSLSMTAAGNDLWITGDGTTLETNLGNSYGCGVIHYQPGSRSSTTYSTKDGINNDFGWDIDSDKTSVFVSHSVKHNHLSHYDSAQQQWSSFPVNGSGNSITLSPAAIWLATASPTRPLTRIDRVTLKKESLSPFSDQEYVSAIGVHNDEIWLGIYEKRWSNSTYTIRSRLGLHLDNRAQH